MNINNFTLQYREWIKDQKAWLVLYVKSVSYDVTSQVSRRELNLSRVGENEILKGYDKIKVISNGDSKTVTVEVSYKCADGNHYNESFVI